ncbi:hypothetical protein PUN4_240026 [Paraburkholderia unamae]|nr:hypothetical protein PUN4_240026 [Paraburkholderia unamae]
MNVDCSLKDSGDKSIYYQADTGLYVQSLVSRKREEWG